MHVPFTLGLSWAAGLHAALFGAWKDSPFESFKPGSFLRELTIATFVGLALSLANALASPFLIFLAAFTLNRIVTEFYKLFVRNTRQDIYRIPTEMHWIGKALNRPVRLLLGMCWLAAIYGMYRLLKLLPHHWSPSLMGPIAGLTVGTAMAIGGGDKDGSVTRSYARKFRPQPDHRRSRRTDRVAGLRFFVLGTIACERMLTELFFKILRPGYVGGHFMSPEPAFPEWMTRRRVFMLPYVLTWALFVGLWITGR